MMHDCSNMKNNIISAEVYFLPSISNHVESLDLTLQFVLEIGFDTASDI